MNIYCSSATPRVANTLPHLIPNHHFSIFHFRGTTSLSPPFFFSSPHPSCLVNHPHFHFTLTPSLSPRVPSPWPKAASLLLHSFPGLSFPTSKLHHSTLIFPFFRRDAFDSPQITSGEADPHRFS
jgi:hypothetical protein